MHGEKEPDSLADLLRPDIHHDLYAVGTEECMRSIAKSTFAPNKLEWVNKLQETLGDKYVMI